MRPQSSNPSYVSLSPAYLAVPAPGQTWNNSYGQHLPHTIKGAFMLAAETSNGVVGQRFDALKRFSRGSGLVWYAAAETTHMSEDELVLFKSKSGADFLTLLHFGQELLPPTLELQAAFNGLNLQLDRSEEGSEIARRRAFLQNKLRIDWTGLAHQELNMLEFRGFQTLATFVDVLRLYYDAIHGSGSAATYNHQ